MLSTSLTSTCKFYYSQQVTELSHVLPTTSTQPWQATLAGNPGKQTWQNNPGSLSTYPNFRLLLLPLNRQKNCEFCAAFFIANNKEKERVRNAGREVEEAEQTIISIAARTEGGIKTLSH